METNEMKLLLEEDPVLQNHAMIKVIGVGAGGSNAVNSMIHDKLSTGCLTLIAKLSPSPLVRISLS